MTKALSEMSLEELWQLFPIRLVEHDDEWDEWYDQEKRAILAVVPHGAVVRISHIGSTAVPGIWAKNIVDILLEVRSSEDVTVVNDALLNHGWLCMAEENARASLNKGYTPDGFADKVFHLHIRVAGDNDELYFRDYLREHADVAQSYEALKLSLWKRFEHDRDGYTQAKTAFIGECTDAAKREYPGRY